jgi:hypothetical protein
VISGIIRVILTNKGIWMHIGEDVTKNVGKGQRLEKMCRIESISIAVRETGGRTV